MIKKKYRLTEKEVRKVLRLRRPFFSQVFIANIMPNNVCNNRYAIILSAKNTPGSVHRNFFRRTFYNIANNTNLQYTSYDIVFSPRKGKFFDKTIETHTIEFVREIEFLLKKIS